MTGVCVFLLDIADQLCYFGGSIFKTLDTLLQGIIYLLLLVKNYCPRIDSTLQSAIIQRLLNCRIISTNMMDKVLNNWNQNPEGQNFHTKYMPDYRGVLEYLFGSNNI